MRRILLTLPVWTLACVTTFVVDPRDDPGTTAGDTTSASSGGDGSTGESDACSSEKIPCDGKCIDPSKEPDHCGQCGNECGDAQACEDGACTSECSGGRSICDRKCVDLQSSSGHCGACEASCGDHEECVDGECACTPPLTGCGDRCVYLPSDPDHCGACFQTCAGDPCGADACQPEGCPPGTEPCGLACADLAVHPLHCGQCGRDCDGDETCVGGECREHDD